MAEAVAHLLRLLHKKSIGIILARRALVWLINNAVSYLGTDQVFSKYHSYLYYRIAIFRPHVTL